MKKNNISIYSKLNKLLLFLVLLVSNTTQAAEFCVDTTAGLYLALLAAESNSEDDHIKVVQGTYTTTGVGAFTYTSSQTFELILGGGLYRVLLI